MYTPVYGGTGTYLSNHTRPVSYALPPESSAITNARVEARLHRLTESYKQIVETAATPR